VSPSESAPTSADAPASSSRAPDAVRHSPLEDAHRALGAKLVPFGGWLMPLAYRDGTLVEHMSCRTEAVAFDVSHLGTVRVEGTGATELLQRELSNDLRKVAPGRAQYTHLLDAADGSVVDDIIVWWLSDDVFDVMPNASNTSRVRDAIGGNDTTAMRAVVAVQGPAARRCLAQVSSEAAAVARFSVTRFSWGGAQCVAAGTGYTGEDGVECAVPVSAALRFWQALLDAGVRPAGLGARDTLRLEAGFPLHGHELGPGITPLQAGLSWVVGWDKGEFRGREALERERARGPRRILRGLVGESRQPPRDGARVLGATSAIGTVTSGNFSPVLGRGIALAFLDTDHAVAVGGEVTIDVRGRSLPAHVVELPFVRAGQSAGASGAAPSGAAP
jgi:aminomethyltransferase